MELVGHRCVPRETARPCGRSLPAGSGAVLVGLPHFPYGPCGPSGRRAPGRAPRCRPTPTLLKENAAGLRDLPERLCHRWDGIPPSEDRQRTIGGPTRRLAGTPRGVEVRRGRDRGSASEGHGVVPKGVNAGRHARRAQSAGSPRPESPDWNDRAARARRRRNDPDFRVFHVKLPPHEHAESVRGLPEGSPQQTPIPQRRALPGSRSRPLPQA